MSGTTTTPLFRVDDALPDAALGQEETESTNQGLADLRDALDDTGEAAEEGIAVPGAAADDGDDAVDDALADAGPGDDGAAGATGTAGVTAEAGDGETAEATGEAGTAGRTTASTGGGTDRVVADAQSALGQAGDSGDELVDVLDGNDGDPAAPSGDVRAAVATLQDEPGIASALVADQTTFAWVTPANNSGAQALARLALDGATLRVTVEGSGFAPGEAHGMTLSGFADGKISGVPTVAQDADGNGRLSTAEAEAATGPALLSLGSAVADADGRLSFAEELDLGGDELAALQTRLDGRHLGIDGLDGDPALPAAGGRLLDIPGPLGAVLEVLTGLAPDLTTGVFTTLLEAQAPFTLAPDGSGPIAPDDVPAADADGYVALIQPSNNSGVVGAAALAFDEAAGRLTVDLDLGGLTPGVEHAMHIHGFNDERVSLLPNFTLDGDEDGFLEMAEAEKVVGPVLVGLTADGSITDAVLTGDFPVADAEGRVSLRQSYQFDLSDPAQAQIFEELQDLVAGRQIEVHGLPTTAAQGAGTGGEVEGEAGYQPNLSVAAGAILPEQGVAGALAAGVGYVIQASLDGGQPTLAGLLEAVQPGLPDDTLIG